MTNYSNNRSGDNIKDGHHADRARTKAQQEADDAKWLAAGFEYRWLRGAPRLHYMWQGDFPVFQVTPGIVGLCRGLVASHPRSSKEILFPYGTSPADIADRLNDEILEIVRYDAAVDELPLDWQPRPTVIGEEIDIDGFMAGRWVRL